MPSAVWTEYTPKTGKKAAGFAARIVSTYTAAMQFDLHDVSLTDLDAVLELNELSVPAVNSIPIEKMQWFMEMAAYFRVAMAGERLAAFLIGLRPGTGYESSNYRWFCENYGDFGYVDRIAVAEHARRFGLASTMYEDFQASLPGSVAVMTCEVNLQPPNPTSMQFHERRGFRQVGSLLSDGGTKEVALMEKTL